ncbi:sensor histidine kinase [Almyronema epifaneia]|uniref:histidine kinase n=1 Tax=Almyronema epifaneia S1 TaxID=2991925 RepID=A0ABW6IDV6_9CYAN
MKDSTGALQLQNLHPLLLRQLKRYLKQTPDEASALDDNCQAFLAAISQAYHEFDEDQAILERSLELSSQELLATNRQLKELLETVEAQVESRTQDLAAANTALEETLQELSETQLQLIQTEKMSSLGQMVAGISHEINNPISFIQGNLTPLHHYLQDLCELLKLYQSEFPQSTPAILSKEKEIDLAFILEDWPKLLTSMLMGTQRVQSIVVSLQNFSRMDEAAVKEVDIHEGIDNTLFILQHQIPPEVEVIRDYGTLPSVVCAPAQLNQAFTHIIANALDAMSDPDAATKQLVITTRAIAGDQIQIGIRDTGMGMSAKVKAKIFDPFFSTKVVGQGTGLGLSICFKIIQYHQGRIEVRSEVGSGTEFLITLPCQALPLEPQSSLTVAATS